MNNNNIFCMKLNNIFTIILICVAVFFAACDDMNDLHIDYLKEGETIYAAKVDSVSPGPGNERIEMELFIKAQRIEFLRFFWNAGSDSVDYNINNQVGIFKCMIVGLPENEYLFNVVSFDKFGNKSLPFEVSAVSYGEYYRGYLTNRRVTAALTDSLRLTFAAPLDEVIYSTLYYLNSSNANVTKVVPADVEKVTIPDFKQGSEFRYTTTYRPAENSPDTFTSDEATGNFPTIAP